MYGETDLRASQTVGGWRMAGGDGRHTVRSAQPRVGVLRRDQPTPSVAASRRDGMPRAVPPRLLPAGCPATCQPPLIPHHPASAAGRKTALLVDLPTTTKACYNSADGGENSEPRLVASALVSTARRGAATPEGACLRSRMNSLPGTFGRLLPRRDGAPSEGRRRCFVSCFFS